MKKDADLPYHTRSPSARALHRAHTHVTDVIEQGCEAERLLVAMADGQQIDALAPALVAMADRLELLAARLRREAAPYLGPWPPRSAA